MAESSDMNASLRILVASALAWGAFGHAAAIGAEPEYKSLTPEVQTAEWAQKWWLPRHEEKLAAIAAAKGKVDLLWIGDSITHSWENQGKPVWEKYYAHRNAFNLGFSGDRTEQVLWRFRNDELACLNPKLAIVMIGTNNTGHRKDPAVETAAGIEAILSSLRWRLPNTKILLLAIFPRGATKKDEMRVLNDQINKRIAKFADNKTIFFKDIASVYLGMDGSLSTDVMRDLLHPTEQGYAMWAEAIEPTVKQLMGEL
jgi:lysophospholipase L1-like esterase